MSNAKEMFESLSKEVGAEQAKADLNALLTETSKEKEVTISLPENFSEVLEESVAKALEAKEKAQKKFKFQGSEASKKELDAVTKKAEGNLFIKHVWQGDYAQAGQLSSVQYRAKALGEATAATAGVLVPELFESTIYSNFDTFSEIIGDARVVDYRGAGDVVNLNQLDAKVVVYETAEFTTTTASTPSYSAPNIEFTKYTAEVVMSEELLEDTEADLLGNLSEQIGEKYAEKVQDRLVNRSTADQQGLLQVSGVTVVTAGNRSSFANLTFKDLLALKTRIATSYNKREADMGKFYMAPGAWEAVINNTTTAGSGFSQYALNPFEGTPKRAHGNDVRVLNEIASPTVSGTKFVVFSDLSRHLVIGRKRGMRLKVNTTGTASDGTNLNTEDARQLVMTARIGHVVVLPSGVAILVT
jgi:HK97 family phage major capsid protein